MKFTYEGYRELIEELKAHGYQVTDYHHWREVNRPCILRHDIDNEPERALALAKLEKELDVTSTYFVLLTSDFYNVFSAAKRKMLREIAAMGHSIGLHFDEVTYDGNEAGERNILNSGGVQAYQEKIISLIQSEAATLSQALDLKIDTVSMHRPSKFCLESDLKIPGIINSYGQEFFHDFKYVSDSRRRWREDVLSYIREEKYPRLHILTHAFWYHEAEKSLQETLTDYIEKAKTERYEILKRNFTRLDEALGEVGT